MEVKVEGQVKGGGQVRLTGGGLALGPGTGGAVDGLTGRLDVSVDLRRKQEDGQPPAEGHAPCLSVCLSTCLPLCLSVCERLLAMTGCTVSC